MIVREILQELRKRSEWAKVSDSPDLDSRLLLSQVLEVSSEKFFGLLNSSWPEEKNEILETLVQKRFSGLPMAYILGYKEFYGRIFRTDPRALIPRPETEILLEEALAFCRTQEAELTILDCCTGSGCLGLSLAKELEILKLRSQVSCSDISTEALSLAKENAQNLGLSNCSFVRGDYLEPFKDFENHFDLICANPPYLSTQEYLEGKAPSWQEPRLAFDGGPDGLEPYRILVDQAYSILKPGGGLFLEIGQDQKKEVLQLLKEKGYSKETCIRDLAGRDRVIRGRK